MAMAPFLTLDALVVPLDRANVDTDAILPKQFLRSVARIGFGPHLFDSWRYLDRGEFGMDCASRPLNDSFPLNQARYRGAQILLTRDNFGCGSSREHAVWALEEFGVRAVIASGFADIFRNNCLKNGLLPIVLPAQATDDLFRAVAEQTGYRLRIDLASQTVTTPSGEIHRFECSPSGKSKLMSGMDEIALTLQHAEEIRNYELRRADEEPWIFESQATRKTDSAGR